jgi:hypothetical protein
MERNPTIGKHASRVAATVFVLGALLAASTADARLPGYSDWVYDTKVPSGGTVFRAMVEFNGKGSGFIYSVDAVLVHGRCKTTKGRVFTEMLVGGGNGSYPGGPFNIPIKPNGRYSGAKHVINDTGTMTLKGVFTGTKMSGTVTLHVHNSAWGDCRATGKFAHVQGVRIA